MIRRALGKSKLPQVDELTIIEVNGQIVKLGDEVRVPPLRGRFIVRQIKPNGEVTCTGGTKNHQAWRTFRAERLVKTNGK